MHFVFEDISSDAFVNFIKCPDVNESGIRRCTPSPMVNSLIRHKGSKILNSFQPYTYSDRIKPGKKYIIATGVAHSPTDWCGPDSIGQGYDKRAPNRKSLFAYLGEHYLADLQAGNAFLLIDQSHEGYQTTWLWSWFHNTCNAYNINPSQIIYVTGNLDSRDQYSEWIATNQLVNKMLVVPYPHFEAMIADTVNNYTSTLPNFEKHVTYKTNKLASIKTYNALQKRPRAHRAWLFKYLHDANLLDAGINSMNMFQNSHSYYERRHMRLEDYDKLIQKLPILPPAANSLQQFADGDCGEYLVMFNEQIMLDSWVTVVSEASFGAEEHTCFISEKTFKPIACYHPFIIFGNKGSLARLRELGYKTFSPYIDESYDELDTWDRMDAVVKEITRLNNMATDDRLPWLAGIRDILTHNYQILSNRSTDDTPIYSNVISEYFKRSL